MQTNLLLPHRCKAIGWVLLFISIISWMYITITQTAFGFLDGKAFAIVGSEVLSSTQYFTVVQANLTYTLTGSLFIVGGLLVAFSREQTEDEYIMKLRLSSLQWAVLLNYSLLLLCFLFVYGMEFMSVMLYNMFTTLILFIARFHYLLFKSKA